MIEDIIGLNEAPLPSNHNYKKMGNVLALLKIRKKRRRNSKNFVASSEKKKSFKCVRPMARTVHCPVTLSY